MNENFDDLKARLQKADPADSSFVLNEGLVAQAPLAKPARAPISSRLRLGLLSGGSVAAAAIDPNGKRASREGGKSRRK